VQEALGGVFVFDPGGDLLRAPAFRAGAALAATVAQRSAALVALGAALAVDGVVAQAAEHPGAIDFRRQQLRARRRATGAAVDGRLLATPGGLDHISDQVALVEVGQCREDPGPIVMPGQEGRVERRLDLGIERLFAQPALHVGVALVAGLGDGQLRGLAD
jgi:hypothetical protein